MLNKTQVLFVFLCLLVSGYIEFTMQQNLFTMQQTFLNNIAKMARVVLAHLSTTCSRGAFRVVMCPSCVVNSFFKHLLFPNHWANLDRTWQECSLGGPLQKLFTEFDSIKKSCCHGNKIEFFKQFF